MAEDLNALSVVLDGVTHHVLINGLSSSATRIFVTFGDAVYEGELQLAKDSLNNKAVRKFFASGETDQFLDVVISRSEDDITQLVFAIKKKVENLKQTLCNVKMDISSLSCLDILNSVMKILKERGDNLRNLTEKVNDLEKKYNESLDLLRKSVEIKEIMEMELFSKFILILNEKKRKIAELSERPQSSKSMSDTSVVSSTKRSETKETETVVSDKIPSSTIAGTNQRTKALLYQKMLDIMKRKAARVPNSRFQLKRAIKSDKVVDDNRNDVNLKSTETRTKRLAVPAIDDIKHKSSVPRLFPEAKKGKSFSVPECSLEENKKEEDVSESDSEADSITAADERCSTTDGDDEDPGSKTPSDAEMDCDKSSTSARRSKPAHSISSEDDENLTDAEQTIKKEALDDDAEKDVMVTKVNIKKENQTDSDESDSENVVHNISKPVAGDLTARSIAEVSHSEHEDSDITDAEADVPASKSVAANRGASSRRRGIGGTRASVRSSGRTTRAASRKQESNDDSTDAESEITQRSTKRGSGVPVMERSSKRSRLSKTMVDDDDDDCDTASDAELFSSQMSAGDIKRETNSSEESTKLSGSGTSKGAKVEASSTVKNLKKAHLDFLDSLI